MNTESVRYGKIYNREIVKIEKRLSALILNKEPKSLYEPCSYILNGGGKRLRPFLVLISAKAVGGNFKNVYNAATAVEVLHNFTLVHDDIMDNSTKRRGHPTLHHKYDLSTAILAGDSLIALAYESLLKDSKHHTAEIVSTFTRGVIEVCEGQSLDKEFEIRQSVTINEYEKMIYKKTAALVRMCCSVGAQLCNATKEQIKIVSEYGKNLGMAFQIQDDLLDIMAEENQFGKTVGSDLLEGKKTYLFLLALEKAKGKEKYDLLKVIQKKGIERSEIEKYRNLYIKLGVLKDAEREIMKYTKLALKNLSLLPNDEGKSLMYWLANILINRDK
ncbi:MAG: polyprenyl synthetase family protein [Ignavibacteriales bacterium]|nr:polyprenyl synthetase family protein [Ignavibacteriales bacterium]